LFKAKSNEIVDYSGDRSLDSFVDFLKSNAANEVKMVTAGSEAAEKKAEEDHDEL
jgi:hypothetical protein